MLSSEEILNHKKERKTRKKRDKTTPRKEKISKETTEEQKSQEIKKLFPEPIIYDPDKNQRNIQLVIDDDNNNFKQGNKDQITRDVKEITNYYLNLHQDIINTYNSIYSQMLKNISNLYLDNFFTVSATFTNYSSEIKNMYTSLSSNKDQSLKLIDNIITENLDTFIKSIEFIQKFYKNVIESYLNCIKKFT